MGIINGTFLGANPITFVLPLLPTFNHLSHLIYPSECAEVLKCSQSFDLKANKSKLVPSSLHMLCRFQIYFPLTLWRNH